MPKITRVLLLTVIMYNTQITLAMDTPHLFILTSEKGNGGGYATIIMPDQRIKRCFISNPHKKDFDFGQKKAQAYLASRVTSVIKTSDVPIVLYACSQETHSAINFSVQNPNQVKALILERVILSGNNAIRHTVKNKKRDLSFCDHMKNIVGDYYAPYCEVFGEYPHYKPAGEQSIFKVDKLPTNLLIIIMHHQKDKVSPIEDALSLYAFLREKQKNPHVYLITVADSECSCKSLCGCRNECCCKIECICGDGMNILTCHETEIGVIQTILKNNNLLPQDCSKKGSSVDPNIYQPEVQSEWLEHFDNVINKEITFRAFDTHLKKTAITSAIASVIAIIAWIQFFS